jgi:hypothetical protein
MDGRLTMLTLARIAHSASLSARPDRVSRCLSCRFLPASSCPSAHPTPPRRRWSLTASRPILYGVLRAAFPTGPNLPRLPPPRYLLAGRWPACRDASTEPASLYNGCLQAGEGTTICVTSPLAASCPCRYHTARSVRHR